MGQIVQSNLRIQEIFHGTCQGYLIPTRLKPAAIPVLPAMEWRVEGASLGTYFPQAAYLSGGAESTAASIRAAMAGVLTVGCVVVVELKQIVIDAETTTVYCAATAQQGDSLSDCVSDLRATINAAIAGSGSFAGGFYYTASGKGTKSQISDGLQAKYPIGAASGTGQELILTAKTELGAEGNNLDVVFEVQPKAPDILQINSEGDPLAAGIEQFSYFEGLSFQFTGQEQTITSSQSFLPIDRYITGADAVVTMNALQDLNRKVLELGLGITSYTRTAEAEVFMPGLNALQKTFGLAITTNSRKVEGKKAVALFYEVAGNGYTQGKQTQHQPLQLNLGVRAVSGRRDTCYVSEPASAFVS